MQASEEDERMSYGKCDKCGEDDVYPSLTADGRMILFCNSCNAEQETPMF